MISDKDRPVSSCEKRFEKHHALMQIKRPQRPSSASVIGRVTHLTPILNIPKVKGSLYYEINQYFFAEFEDKPVNEERMPIFSNGRSRRITLDALSTPKSLIMEPAAKSFLPPITGAIKPSLLEQVAPSESHPRGHQPILNPKSRQISQRNVILLLFNYIRMNQ